MDGVFQDFRRLTPHVTSVLRAICLANWQVEDPARPWVGRAALIAEVQQVQRNHNLTAKSAIEETAWALLRYTRARDLNRALACLGPKAQAIWRTTVADPAELEQRIVRPAGLDQLFDPLCNALGHVHKGVAFLSLERAEHGSDVEDILIHDRPMHLFASIGEL